MIDQLLSAQAKKAWVAGVVTAFLQPVVTLLAGNGEITLTSLVGAVLGGVLAAVMVFSTSNAPAPVLDEPGAHAVDG